MPKRGVVTSILKLSATPPNIIYPLPLLPLLVFIQSSNRNVISLIYLIAFSSIFYAGVNLWNHVNDVEEDRLAGKANVLIENSTVRRLTAILSVFLYLIAFVMVVRGVRDPRGVVLCFVVVFVTWVYSDKTVMGRVFRRWKEHYVTELLTYVIAIPTFTLTLWSLVDTISTKAFALAITMTFFMLSGTFLKDIKDTTGDELAGLRTLAVVFNPSTLIRLSFLMVWLYYLSLSLAIVGGVFDSTSLLAILPSSALLYSTIKMCRNGWKIDRSSVRYVRVLIYSSLTSLALFIISGFLSRAW